MKSDKNLPAVNRRQFLASAGIGALLGSAVGLTFLDSELNVDHATLTMYRTPGLFAMLIEHEDARILLLDGDDDLPITQVTESVAGFLRQRIDIVLASDPVLRNIPLDFVDRWKVEAIFAIPDRYQPFTSPLDDNALTIGDLQVSANGVPFGLWRGGYGPDSRAWYISIRYGSSRCDYSDSWNTLMTIGHRADADVTLLVTNDSQSRVSEANDVDVIGVPEDAIDALSEPDLAAWPIPIVRLYQNYPTQIRLLPDAIILPDHG